MRPRMNIFQETTVRSRNGQKKLTMASVIRRTVKFSFLIVIWIAI